MKKWEIVILIIVVVLIIGIVGYASWYSYERQNKIIEAEECKSQNENPFHLMKICSTLVPPSVWDLAHGDIAVQGIPNLMKLNPYSLKDVLIGNYTVTIDLGPKMTLGLLLCDQSATTTDCSKIPQPAQEQSPYSHASLYTEITSTDQSGKIDEHLFVDNSLIEFDWCGNKFKTRQITIDGADVVKWLAELAKTNEKLCPSEFQLSHKDGVVRTLDVRTYDSRHPERLGLTYILRIDGSTIHVNPSLNLAYFVSEYDGSIDGPMHKFWKTYTNESLGVSFDYPDNFKTFRAGQWGVGNGTTGKSFSMSLELPSGATIRASATTKDYSAEKGGFGVGTQGFIKDGDKYRIVWKAVPAEVSFVSDEKWQLSDGSEAIVIYRKNYDPYADYAEPPISVMVNLYGSEFNGLGFLMWNSEDRQALSSLPEDITILKKIITSIKFLN